MKLFRLFIIFLIITFSSNSFSKTSSSLSFSKSLRQKVRTIKGRPGKNYWQNKSIYDLKVNFIPSQNLIQGKGKILYFNNSKNYLKEIIFQLNQNAYREDSIRSRYIDPENNTSGIEISNLKINGEVIPQKSFSVIRTIGKISLKKKLKPKGKLEIELDWKYTLSKSDYETSFDGKIIPGSFFLNQWYPKISVFDDLSGWNKKEFDFLPKSYNEFSDYSVEFTIPSNYTIHSNAILENSNVYENKILTKVFKKFKESETRLIHNPSISIKDSIVTKTWKWKKNSTPDIQFVITSNMGWKEYFSHNNKFSIIYHKSSINYSSIPDSIEKFYIEFNKLFPGLIFPDTKIIIVDGSGTNLTNGIINLQNNTNKISLARELYKELIRLYLFEKIGIDKFNYAWFEEGIINYLEYTVSKNLFKSTQITPLHSENYILSRDPILKKEVITSSNKLSESEYWVLSSGKSGILFKTLSELIGEEVFLKCLVSFLVEWKYKYPTAEDFMNYLHSYTKKNWDWFWKLALYYPNYPDLKIGKLKEFKTFSILEIENKGGFPIPIFLKIYYDNDEELIQKPADIWKKTKKVKIKIPGQPERIILGDENYPDARPENNYWQRKSL
ncbi:MAG: hypothetical protein KDK36_13810 [Leptospiraceae bacterium]|nr:hypothetical protein [Leptospiraceae bacterium]